MCRGALAVGDIDAPPSRDGAGRFGSCAEGCGVAAEAVAGAVKGPQRGGQDGRVGERVSGTNSRAPRPSSRMPGSTCWTAVAGS